jgi:hypothetical protein
MVEKTLTMTVYGNFSQHVEPGPHFRQSEQVRNPEPPM